MTKKRLFLLFIVISAVVAGYFYFGKNTDNQITYLTETVQRGNLQKNVVATGTVRAYNRVEVGAQVSGKIEKIYVTLGQKVKAGEIIAEIDSSTQRNTLDTASAKLAAYQAQLKARKVAYSVAKSSYNRLAKLYVKKSASLDEFEHAKDTLASAEAAIDETNALIKQAEIELSNAKTNLGYTKIVAPIDATVISIPVSVGQTVNANQTTPTIVQVADLSKVLIKPEISEGDIIKVNAGMTVAFSTLSDPDTVYHAKIDSVDPAMTTLTDNEYKESISDTNAIYYYANLVVDNPDNKLRIGMTTQNHITIANVENVLLVPTITLKRQKNKVFVNVLIADNQVEQREVEIGINDDINTQILSGLQEGEKVISSQVTAGETVGAVRRPRMF
ncbi:membrane-fusion protein [Actinobacillus seminis]|uniref:Membrane-fusion protein n=1 Tax=Actinobacillus seminis TaxID=722 RepID=A0A380VDE1_9PAST|nr:efflux RND transporter periplasmic adaptor subunit [Actinobacillus seminis]SUU36401.1 membrane-fusion protein [Actinobacillus seminis]